MEKRTEAAKKRLQFYRQIFRSNVIMGWKEGRKRPRQARPILPNFTWPQTASAASEPTEKRKKAPFGSNANGMLLNNFFFKDEGKNRILLCPTRLFKAILSHFFRLVDDDDDVGDDVDDDDVESSLNVKRENSGEVSVERNTCSAKTLPTSGRKLGLVSLRQPPMRDSYKRLLREVPDFFPENRKSFRETENFRKSLR